MDNVDTGNGVIINTGNSIDNPLEEVVVPPPLPLSPPPAQPAGKQQMVVN